MSADSIEKRKQLDFSHNIIIHPNNTIKPKSYEKEFLKKFYTIGIFWAYL